MAYNIEGRIKEKEREISMYGSKWQIYPPIKWPFSGLPNAAGCSSLAILIA
jgi:hypothetical protein